MNAFLIVAAVCALFVALLVIVATVRSRSRELRKESERQARE